MTPTENNIFKEAIKELKDKVVRSQRYEKAATLREYERKMEIIENDLLEMSKIDSKKFYKILQLEFDSHSLLSEEISKKLYELVFRSDIRNKIIDDILGEN
jgi:hypothetical protein